MTRQKVSGKGYVLLVTRNLPPLLGGMERLNLQLARELRAAYRVKVIGPAGSRAALPPDVEVVEVPASPLPLFICRALWASWRAAADKPLFAIAGSGLLAPMVNLVAWRSGAKPIAYVHGLDLVARHPVYRLFWIPALRRLAHAFANSASTADIARREGVAAGRITILHPGVATPGCSAGAAADFRVRHRLGQARILLSVGRMTPRKGLREFVERSLPAICSRHADAVLVIVGDEAPDALSGRGRGRARQVLAAAAERGCAANTRVIGVLDDAALSGAYAAADVHVFPVREWPGDIEGFGMVALEAAAHGLPTVAFAVGGVPDAVRDGHSGHMLAPGDYAGFADRVCLLLDAGDSHPMRASARSFASGFGWEKFGGRLLAALAMLSREPASPVPTQRGGHAVLDLGSRALKARKIEALMDLGRRPRRLRMLEIGTGSGGIAHYFANHPSLDVDVDAIDVEDARQISEGYRFTRVAGTGLPFADGSFDIVVTNHVIEHVGEEAAQREHLAEVRRVLAPDGHAYLAVPNRWMLVEPHFRLAFLSWLPPRLRSPYLRWRRGIARYDCEPLSLAKAEELFRQSGLAFENITVPALRLTLELEGGQRSTLRRIVASLPDSWIALAGGIIPTLIFRLSHGAPERTAGS